MFTAFDELDHLARTTTVLVRVCVGLSSATGKLKRCVEGKGFYVSFASCDHWFTADDIEILETVIGPIDYCPIPHPLIPHSRLVVMSA